MSKISRQAWAKASMVLVAFIWGTTFVVVKDALMEIGPFLFLGLRFMLAFLVLAFLAFSSLRKLTWSTVWSGCLLGVFLFIGYTFQTVGLKYTTSSNAGFITGISVVLVPIIYALFNRTFPSLRTLLTVLAATTGLFLLSFPKGSLTLAYGDFLVLICAFAFAFHIVFVDRFSHLHNAVAITAIQVLFVGLLCSGIGLAIEPWPGRLSPKLVGAILVTSIFATSLAFLLQNALQKYSTPTRFAVVLTMEPVFAALAGFLWAGEMLSSRGLVGAGLILSSMLISILLRKPTEPIGEKL